MILYITQVEIKFSDNILTFTIDMLFYPMSLIQLCIYIFSSSQICPKFQKQKQV